MREFSAISRSEYITVRQLGLIENPLLSKTRWLPYLSSIMNISLALETLRNAPSEDLRDHINEAVATFREIEARLKDVCSPQ